MIAVALTLFPKLALGMSGFETGVAVMSHVAGRAGDDPRRPAARIRNTKKLLTTAACIMSVYLIASSLVTTLADPRRASSRTAARPTAGRWPTWRTSTSARPSARRTTSRRS